MLSHRLLRNMVSPTCKHPCQNIHSHFSWPERNIGFGGGSGSLHRRIRSAEMDSHSWKADDAVPLSSPTSNILAGSTFDANHKVLGIINQHKLDVVAENDVVPFASSAATIRPAKGTSDANVNVAGAIPNEDVNVAMDIKDAIQVQTDVTIVNEDDKHQQLNGTTENDRHIHHSDYVTTDTENSIHKQVDLVIDNVGFFRTQFAAGKLDDGFCSHINSSDEHTTHLEQHPVDVNIFHVKSSGLDIPAIHSDPDCRMSNWVNNTKATCHELEFSERESPDIHVCPGSSTIGQIPGDTQKHFHSGTRKRSSDTDILSTGSNKKMQCFDISNSKRDNMNILDNGNNNSDILDNPDISNNTEAGNQSEKNTNPALPIGRNIKRLITLQTANGCGRISNRGENIGNSSPHNNRNTTETYSNNISAGNSIQDKDNGGRAGPSQTSPLSPSSAAGPSNTSLFSPSSTAGPSHRSPLTPSSAAGPSNRSPLSPSAATCHSSPLSPSSSSWLINENFLLWIAHRTNWNPFLLTKLSCVCKKAAAITQRVLWRQFCLSRAPKMVSDLIRHSRNGYIDGGWLALAKLFLYCPGCRGGLDLHLPVPGHLQKERTRFSKTSGRSFLIPQCRTDTLYISDPCEHPNEPEYVGIFRGVFKGFDRSRTKWLLTSTPWIHFDENEVCPYCNARVWSMGAARMIPASASARLAAYEGNVEYFVCLNGHVNGKCAILPLSGTDSSD